MANKEKDLLSVVYKRNQAHGQTGPGKTLFPHGEKALGGLNAWEDVIVWMVRNQLARRNLASAIKIELALRSEDAIAQKAKANQAVFAGNQHTGLLLNSTKVQPTHTRAEIAAMSGTSEDSVRKVKSTLQNGHDFVIDKMRSEKISINRADEMTKALEDAAHEVVEAVERYGVEDPQTIVLMTHLHDEELASVLSEEEGEQLEACEQVIENGLKIWYQVGEALLHIRDSRLYREVYATFEDYLSERWDMSRSRAHRLIDASQVALNLLPIGNILANEAQARELVPFAPEEQRLIVEVAKEIFRDRKPTAADFKSLGTVLREVTATGAIDDGTGVHSPDAQAIIQVITGG